jgi:hypothetical protein
VNGNNAAFPSSKGLWCIFEANSVSREPMTKLLVRMALSLPITPSDTFVFPECDFLD